MTSSTPDALWASPSARLLQPAAIFCTGIRRAVGGLWLLDSVDLSVSPGSRLLLVSEPPAAAHLLLRILAGLARPAAGTFQLAGGARADASAAGWARRVAYVGPDAEPSPWLSPAEVLDLAGRLAGLEATERADRISALVERHRLGGALHRPLRRSGPAVAQRTTLAAALITDPDVLLLVEPLRAEEPSERLRLLRLPGRLRTLVIASHLPAGEMGLVDQVALLHGGRLVLHVPLSELAAHGLGLSLHGLRTLAELPDPAGSPRAAAGR